MITGLAEIIPIDGWLLRTAIVHPGIRKE